MISNNIYRYAKGLAMKVLRDSFGKKVSQLTFSMPIVRFTYPVLSPGGAREWDEDDVHSHWVFQDPSGKYWMYYNGKQRPGPKKGIGLAVSEDGINFHKNAKNPLLIPTPGTWESHFLWKCQVLKIGENDFRMWYGGHSKKGLGQVGYASSSDGTNWKKYDRNPILTVGNSGEWDSEHAENFRVIYERSTDEFKGLYYGKKKVGKSAIGLATSHDGIKWTKFYDNPVLKPLPNSWEEEEISPFHLMKVDDLYILFYEAIGRFNNWMIGIAYSQDLLNWYRDPRNPVIRPGFSGDFDAEFVSDPCIVVDSDVLKLYYGASAGNGSRYTGLAYLPLKEKFSDYVRDKGVAWNKYLINAGDKTDGITCRGYDCEINFISDAEGTLSMSIRELNGNWQNYDAVTTPAGRVKSYSIRDAMMIKLSFNRAATVTAWYIFKRLKLYEDVFAPLLGRKER